jgi:hypothetical protein
MKLAALSKFTLREPDEGLVVIVAPAMILFVLVKDYFLSIQSWGKIRQFTDL